MWNAGNEGEFHPSLGTEFVGYKVDGIPEMCSAETREMFGGESGLIEMHDQPHECVVSEVTDALPN